MHEGWRTTCTVTIFFVHSCILGLLYPSVIMISFCEGCSSEGTSPLTIFIAGHIMWCLCFMFTQLLRTTGSQLSVWIRQNNLANQSSAVWLYLKSIGCLLFSEFQRSCSCLVCSPILKCTFNGCVLQSHPYFLWLHETSVLILPLNKWGSLLYALPYCSCLCSQHVRSKGSKVMVDGQDSNLCNSGKLMVKILNIMWSWLWLHGIWKWPPILPSLLTS